MSGLNGELLNHLLFGLQLQNDIGDRAPAYLRDLIGRLSTFSDEPRLAGLVGFVVTLLVDMVYTSKRSSVRRKLAGSSSSQVDQGECAETVEKEKKLKPTNIHA